MKKFFYFSIIVCTMSVVGCASGRNYYRTKMPIPPPRVISESAMSADSIPAEATTEESSSASPALAAPAPTQAASGTMSVYASPELLAEWRAEQAAKKSQPKTETKAVQAPKSPAPQAKARTSGNISQSRIQKIENRLGLLEDRFDNSVAGKTQGGLLHFRSGSTALSSEGKNYLNSLAQRASAGAIRNVRIAGYASQSGKREINITLSQKRAEAVRDYLAGKNVPAEIVVGGETDRYGINTNVVVIYDEKN